MPVKTLLGSLSGCHIWHTGWYEPQVVEALRPFLTAETCFFDIGSHIGQYTLLASPLVREVHSFEASPRTWSLLKWNVRRNLLNNVRANQMAVSDHDGTALFCETDVKNTGGWHLQTVGSSGIQVPCTRIDSYLAGIRPAKRYVMKIDVEGAEMLVFSGAEHFLSLRPIIMIEIIDGLQRRFGHSAQEVKEFISDHGYNLSSVDTTNFLALPLDDLTLRNDAGS